MSSSPPSYSSFNDDPPIILHSYVMLLEYIYLFAFSSKIVRIHPTIIHIHIHPLPNPPVDPYELIALGAEVEHVQEGVEVARQQRAQPAPG